MQKFRGKDIAVFVLVLGILAAGVYSLVDVDSSSPTTNAPAVASMTPEELAAENEVLTKQAHDASMELQMIAAGGSKSANTWVEKYCKDRRDAPLPEDPAAANVELKARVREARTVFEELQAEQRKEMHWLTQYYAAENEQTLEKLGIQSHKLTLNSFVPSEELDAILSPIQRIARILSNGFSGYFNDHRDGKKLETVLDTPEHMAEVFKPYLEKDKVTVDFSNGRWSFYGNNKTCWIGYNLEGIPQEVRTEMIKNFDVKNHGYKSMELKDGEYEPYDGGNMLYWNVIDERTSISFGFK